MKDEDKERCMFIQACLCIFLVAWYNCLHVNVCAQPHVPPICWVMYHTGYSSLELTREAQMFHVEWETEQEKIK